MTELFLRPIQLNDVSLINTFRNDPELVSYLGANFRFISVEKDVEWFEKYLREGDKSSRAIIECSKKGPVGMVSLTNIDHFNKNAEFSIQLWTNRGKGYGKRASALMLAHGFDDLNLHRIYLTVLETNQIALNMYRSLGFELEGVLKDAIFKNGKYQNFILMSIIKR